MKPFVERSPGETIRGPQRLDGGCKRHQREIVDQQDTEAVRTGHVVVSQSEH
jgi:hypothetical protein